MSIVWNCIIRTYRSVSIFFSLFMASLDVDDFDGGMIMLFAPDLSSVFPFGITEVASTLRVVRDSSLTSLVSVFVSSLLTSLVPTFWLLILCFSSSSSDNNRSPKGSSKSYTNKNQVINYASRGDITNFIDKWRIHQNILTKTMPPFLYIHWKLYLSISCIDRWLKWKII